MSKKRSKMGSSHASRHNRIRAWFKKRIEKFLNVKMFATYYLFDFRRGSIMSKKVEYFIEVSYDKICWFFTADFFYLALKFSIVSFFFLIFPIPALSIFSFCLVFSYLSYYKVFIFLVFPYLTYPDVFIFLVFSYLPYSNVFIF